QLANEADGIRDQDARALLQLDRAGRGVERREQAVLDQDVRARKGAQNGGLAGVGVADERDAELLRTRLPLRRAPPRHDLELAPQLADPPADDAAVRLELRLTRAAQADASADPREVRPHPLQPRQHVLELRELDLHLRLGRARTRREDVQDELG